MEEHEVRRIGNARGEQRLGGGERTGDGVNATLV